MLFNPEIERMPLPQLRALQAARLTEQVAYVYDRVPFCRQKLDALGGHPATFRSLEDMPKLGFTKKTDVRENYPYGLVVGPEHEAARLHCSSGTTGKTTASDLAVFAATVPCWLGMKLRNACCNSLFTGRIIKPANVSVALFTLLSAVRWVEWWYQPSRNLSAAELEADHPAMLLDGLKNLLHEPFPQLEN